MSVSGAASHQVSTSCAGFELSAGQKSGPGLSRQARLIYLFALFPEVEAYLPLAVSLLASHSIVTHLGRKALLCTQICAVEVTRRSSCWASASALLPSSARARPRQLPTVFLAKAAFALALALARALWKPSLPLTAARVAIQ